MSKDTKIKPTTTLEVQESAVNDGEVKLLITRVGHWMDGAEGRNSMRTGFEGVPFGNLVVSIPIDGAQEELTLEELSRFLERGLSSLYLPVKVFTSQNGNDF